MLRSLKLSNFTVFAEATLAFSPSLNVIVGQNGAGKSHVLKAAYTVAAVSARGERDSGSEVPSKSYLEKAIAKKLRGVFRPDELGRLVTRKRGRNRCEIVAKFKTTQLRMGFAFNTSSKSEVSVEPCPQKWEGKPPVFLPARELLTIYPGFVSLYETTELPFEETWRDTCLLLGAPLARGPRLVEIKKLLDPLEQVLGGTVELDEGRFYLKLSSGKMEAHLVAEGFRKLAMIARLIATGSLIGTGSLFWDEPEANLNPKVIKSVARTILQLCLSGIQVFVASHSLFLIRELDILLHSDDFNTVESRFFGLHLSSGAVNVEQGDSIDDIGTIDALQEELSQSDRYLQSDAN